MHDGRNFEEWRKDTAAHFVALAAITQKRAAVNDKDNRYSRRASAMRKIARLLETLDRDWRG